MPSGAAQRVEQLEEKQSKPPSPQQLDRRHPDRKIKLFRPRTQRPLIENTPPHPFEKGKNEITQFQEWVDTIDDQELLRRLEVILLRRREGLIESGQPPLPLKTLIVSTVRGKEYIVESWWDKKPRLRHVSKAIEADTYDFSLVTISKRVREKIKDKISQFL